MRGGGATSGNHKGPDRAGTGAKTSTDGDFVGEAPLENPQSGMAVGNRSYQTPLVYFLPISLRPAALTRVLLGMAGLEPGARGRAGLPLPRPLAPGIHRTLKRLSAHSARCYTRRGQPARFRTCLPCSAEQDCQLEFTQVRRKSPWAG